MSKKEVAKLLYEAGWTDAVNLAKMLATAYGEANLYTEAWHWNDPAADPPGDGSTDWGYLELNDGNKGGKSPDQSGNPVAGGSKSLDEVKEFRAMALDPVRATAHAREMYKQRGFQPWAAFNSGAYKDFIPAANVGIGNFVRERIGIPSA